jgi:gliding motility-associated-like protein
MKKLFTLFSLLISIALNAQHCPELGPDQILPCGVGSTVLTADLSQCAAGTNPKQTTNYTVTNIPYVAQTNTGTQLFMGDDTQQGPFNIGFTFCFFGQSYTQFYVGSNGWISFSPAQPTTFTSNSIPTGNALVPKNCIMGPWQDWHPGIGGQIKYQTSGTAPCRKLTVSWIGVPMFQCTGNQGTFHIVIYESTNIIENHIQDKPACIGWQGGTATQGLHNQFGTAAVTVPGRNSTAWVANNDSWQYNPNGPTVNPVLTWYQIGNLAPIGTGTSITVTPNAAGNSYTCRFVYPTCNSGWATCNAVSGLGPDTVFVQPGTPIPIITPIIASDTVCYLDNSEIYSTNLNPLYNYNWTSVAPITSGNGTNSIDVNWSSMPAGTYTNAIQVIANQNGCFSTPQLFNVTVLNVLPVIDPIGPFCSYDEFTTLSATPIGGIFTGPGVVGNDFTPLNAIGTDTITYTYIQSGCVFDTTVQVVVYPQPVLDSISPYNQFYEICDYDSVAVTYTAFADLPGYNEWTFGGNTTQQNSLSVVWNSIPGTYTMSVIHVSNGCVSNIQENVITIERCPDNIFYIPNSFTPDGDEWNNTLKFVLGDGFDATSFHVVIYNRWGQLIFESFDPTSEWDGTYNNAPCPIGVYAYMVQFNDKLSAARYEYVGHVNIIK